MIIRMLLISFSLYMGVNLCGQNSRVSQAPILYNVEDSTPVCRIVSTAKKNGYDIYYYFGKQCQKIPANVYFIGGDESLSAYMNKMYWNRETYDGGYNMGSCIYTILFDQNLDIKEVKIVYKSILDTKDNFDEIIKSIIFSTKGKWKISNETPQSKWYFAIKRFIIRS